MHYERIRREEREEYQVHDFIYFFLSSVHSETRSTGFSMTSPEEHGLVAMLLVSMAFKLMGMLNLPKCTHWLSKLGLVLTMREL